MLIDARQVPTGSQIAADLCIVGAGAAGISIALQLIGKPLKVILLEGGGTSSDPATQSLYAGEVVGLPCLRPDMSRSRFLGGSTNCWGGWCRPLDALDMENRSWIPNSGWPISRDELRSYYQRSHDLLKLGPFEYSEEYWNSKLANDSIHFLPLKGDGLRNLVCQLSPPVRFGEMYGEALKTASNIDVYLHANVTEFETDQTGSRVVGIKVANLDGGRFVVSPTTVALCAGGIENARLLLASNRVREAGIGNEHDVVGRYFSDHPTTRRGKVRLAGRNRYRTLYDFSLAHRRRGFKLAYPNIAAHVAPSEGLQREALLPNSRTYLVAQYFQSLSASYNALKQIRQTLYNRQKFGVPLSEAIKEIKDALPVLLRQAPQLAVSVLDNRFNPAFVERDFHVQTIIEPVPNPDSRITLSSARDRLGSRIVKVDWRLTDLDKQNFRKVHDLVIAELQKAGVITLIDDESNVADEWPVSVEGCWHHMGTTRMHINPRKGVVDSNCKVHGVSNLFIAGSSVFPTVGSDTPTITIVALALRLANRLEQMLTQPVRVAS